MLLQITSPHRREWLFLALVFVVAFLAYTWGNQFPYYYHSDEESKALQLLYGFRNYWHPMLTLNATDALCRLFQVGKNPQRMTELGRTMAALFSSIGVVSLVSFAIRRKGFFVGVLTGLLLLTFPLLFEVSHYCKEDPALFMALALSLCAWQAFLTKPDQRRAVLLGLCAGLALSAKYPGAFLLPCYALAILIRCKSLRLAGVFLAVALSLALAINWQWAFHFPEMLVGLRRENHMLAAGHDGVAGGLPHTLYFGLLIYEHGWPLLLLALCGALAPLVRGERITLELMLTAIVLVSLGVLSCLAKVSDRYLLPVMVIVLYLGAIGIAWLGGLAPRQYRVPLYALLFAAVSWHQISLLVSFIRDFRSDSRADLVAWMQVHLPKDAKVATSLWTRLPGLYEGEYFSNATPPDYVADHGTFQDLKNAGYTWVAVTSVEAGRFTGERQVGDERQQATYQRRADFYRQLRADNPPVWSEPVGLVYILHPGISLYRLR